MAEEKKNGKSIEITFKLKDHLTNTGIGNAEIELYSRKQVTSLVKKVNHLIMV